jgi:hypothetical protein
MERKNYTRAEILARLEVTTTVEDEHYTEAAMLAMLEETNAVLARSRAVMENEKRRAVDLTRRLKEATKRARAASKHARVAERDAQAEKCRADAAIQRADLEEQLGKGKYYSPIESVWIGVPVPYNNARMFEEMRREKAPNQQERQQVGTANSNVVTLKEAMPNPLHQAAGGEGSVNTEDENLAMWPVNLFGRRSAYAGIVYLIPVCSEHASTYSDVARCVLGLGDEAPQDILQCIHGSLNDEGTRIHGTGIKHSPNNTIRFPNNATYFEKLPCVLIVPIMSLQQIRDWNLEGYQAIVLAGSYNDTTAGEVCRGIQMTNPGPLAIQEEIDLACESLAQVVQGMAFSLDHRVDQRQENFLEEAMQDLLASFRTGLQTSDGRQVIVPMKSRIANLRVLKVTFQPHTPARGRRRTGHVAPDPLILITKSAINWSRRNGQQLLVTGERPEEEIDEDSFSEEL